MAWYRNVYDCSECGASWEDEWSCACDDECPECGTSDFSPVKTDDLSAYIEVEADGTFSIYYSPPSAGHYPDYERLVTVKDRNLAAMLREVAINISQPE
jgi:predicted  nucleic acid-binding Zn-ribbon protein